MSTCTDNVKLLFAYLLLSDDMGNARRTACNNDTTDEELFYTENGELVNKDQDGWMWKMYKDMGYVQPGDVPANDQEMLPLV